MSESSVAKDDVRVQENLAKCAQTRPLDGTMTELHEAVRRLHRALADC